MDISIKIHYCRVSERLSEVPQAQSDAATAEQDLEGFPESAPMQYRDPASLHTPQRFARTQSFSRKQRPSAGAPSADCTPGLGGLLV